MRTLDCCRHIYYQLENERIKEFQSQANARYIFYGVKESNMPQFDSHLDERLMLVAYMYLSIGFDFSLYGEKEFSSKSFEQAGTLLEHIHRNKEHQNSISAYSLLIGSLAFYCGGQFSKAFVLANEISNESIIGNSLKLFLHKDFNQLQSEIDKVLLTKNNADSNDRKYALAWSYILGFLQFGETELLNRGVECIETIKNNAIECGEPDLWWVCKLTIYVMNQLKTTSLWMHIPKLGDNKKLTDAYIHHLLYSKNIIELFKTQIEALNVIIKGEGAVISLPTSSGKTRIAEMAIIKSLITNPASAILYIAPFRSLAYEVESDFGNLFPALGFQVSHLYGSNDFSLADKQAMEESSVWIATPEKIKAIFRGCGFYQKHISLVIIDEGHLIDSNLRNMANEVFFEELRIYVEKGNGKFLLLSAVLPNAQDIAYWLTHDSTNCEVSDWRISSQRKGVIIGETSKVHLSWAENYNCFNRNFIINNKLDWKTICANVAQRLQPFGSVLIYVAKANWIISQAKAIYNIIKNEPDMDWGNDVDWFKFVLICEEEDQNSEFLKFAKKGILCHNAGLSDEMRNSIERLLRKGKARFVVATSTLAQGVNIGVSTVIFACIDFSHYDYISKRDFWNVAGRAGRAFVDTEGHILYYVNATKIHNFQNEWNRAWEYMHDQKIDNVTSGVKTYLDNIWNWYIASYPRGTVEELMDVIDNNGNCGEIQESITSLKNTIDDTLLSIDLSLESKDDIVLHYLNSTLAIYQSESNRKDIYKQILMHRIRYIRRHTGDDSTLFSVMGLTLCDSISLFTNLDAIENIVNTYSLSNRDLSDLLSLIDKIENYILELPSNRMEKVEKKLLDTYREEWLQGNIIKKPTDRKKVTKFYKFSMTWVMNALVGYYNSQNKQDFATLLMDINICIRIGVPNVLASRVYEVGIKSRKAAIEISNRIIYCDKESKSDIQKKIIQLNIEDGFSETTKRWLSIFQLDKTKQNQKIKTLTQIKMRFANNDNNRLLVRKVANSIYACNVDYSFISPINIENKDMDIIVNILGVYLKKRDDIYELVSDNDMYRIER